MCEQQDRARQEPPGRALGDGLEEGDHLFPHLLLLRVVWVTVEVRDSVELGRERGVVEGRGAG